MTSDFFGKIRKLKNKTINALLIDTDITGASLHYINLLHMYKGLTLTEMSGLLEVDKANTTRVINDLEKKGYVYRDVEDHKTKKYKVRLTKDGEDIAIKIKRRILKQQDSIFSCLTEEEKKQLEHILLKLKNSINERND